MHKALTVLTLSIALAGCGEPKLDGSSEQAFKESIDKAASKLPADQQKQFREDVMLVALKDLDFSALLKGGELAADGMLSNARTDLNGKTAAEVMSHADAIRTERQRKEREQAIAEIQELLNKKSKADAARLDLMKFSVTRSRFYLKDREYSYQKEPVIEIAVTNGTTHPISRAYFRGTIASPGRSIPWLVDTFNYQISGGLEPGESAEWALAPNMFSEWGKVEAPADAVFTVETYKLDGPDGETLFNSEGLSEHEEKRLAELQSKYTGS